MEVKSPMKCRITTLALFVLLAACGDKQSTPAEAPGPKPAAEAPAAPAEENAPAVENAPAEATAPAAETAPVPTADPGPESAAELAARKRAELLAPEAPAGGEQVVAWSGEVRLHRQEFEQYLNRLPLTQRREYSSLEKKQEMLHNMIRFETLARLASEAGLEEDPDVRLALKTEMVKKYLERNFGEGRVIDVDEAAVEARYKEHFKRYNKPERVRASHIFVADEAAGRKVLAELKAAIVQPGTSVRKVFREFVHKYSQDEATVKRGGDLLFFSADGSRDAGGPIDPAVAAAAFAMQNTNQVSALIKGENGYHILLLTNRRDKVEQPLEEVRESIRASLEQEEKDRRRKQFMEGLVDFDRWHVDSQVLDRVVVESVPSRTDVRARVDSIRKEAPPKEAPAKEAPSKEAPSKEAPSKEAPAAPRAETP